MDRFRYCVALLVVMVGPTILVYWLAIHRWIRLWRRLGAAATLGAVWSFMLVSAAGLFRARGWLLSVDFGTHRFLAIAGLICLGIAGWLGWELRRNFGFRVLLGLPELAPSRYPARLIAEGVHARVRHPRYVQLFVALAGWSLLANYAASYAVCALWIPGVWVMARLEERELRERFGPAYEEYCRRVPAFVPRRPDRS